MKSSKGKYIFGITKLSEKGQIVIPKEAREVFGLKPGDQLLMMGDIKKGLALVKVDEIGLFEALAEKVGAAEADGADSTDGADGANGKGGDPS